VHYRRQKEGRMGKNMRKTERSSRGGKNDKGSKIKAFQWTWPAIPKMRDE
jgi:hypothetical protein